MLLQKSKINVSSSGEISKMGKYYYLASSLLSIAHGDWSNGKMAASVIWDSGWEL